MKARIYQRPDGKVYRTFIAPQTIKEGETWEQAMDRAAEKLTWKDYPHIDIEAGDLPPLQVDGKCKRCNWRIQGNAVVIDDTAGDCQHAKIYEAEKAVEEELKKPSPNPAEFSRLSMALEKARRGM